MAKNPRCPLCEGPLRVKPGTTSTTPIPEWNCPACNRCWTNGGLIFADDDYSDEAKAEARANRLALAEQKKRTRETEAVLLAACKSARDFMDEKGYGGDLYRQLQAAIALAEQESRK